MKWNNSWIKELEKLDESMYIRLCECSNRKSDIPKMAILMYKHNKEYTAEACLYRMIEWVVDWNGQCFDFEITDEDYEKMLIKVLKGIDKVSNNMIY